VVLEDPHTSGDGYAQPLTGLFQGELTQSCGGKLAGGGAFSQGLQQHGVDLVGCGVVSPGQFFEGFLG